ncbi:MAG: hypothetical protein LBU61_02295 [Coriobacteriales bacterium]|jgi:hypothetical protein|nr:hypothetical protein [Coriobacteriales bacterium]
MAISMSARENYLACLNHKPHQYTPGMTDLSRAGMTVTWELERGKGGAGVDAFGVRWVSPPSAMGGALPAPNEFMLEDVTQWKKIVKIPDLSVYDWEGGATAEEPILDRANKVVEFGSINAVYERLATLMGFEGALLAMALEPEATYELLDTLTDWKIELMKYGAKYFKPDTYSFNDDVATERTLFMSPETYRTLIKPMHKKLVDAVKELGIIPIQHTCGKADIIVQDMIDEGNHGWSAVQASNDIESIIEKHGDEFVIIGGYDTVGTPGIESVATDEIVRKEVRRCMDTYGKYGKGYIFSGLVLIPGTAADPVTSPSPLGEAIIDEFLKIRAEQTA